MGSSLLFVFGFVLTCGIFVDARFLSTSRRNQRKVEPEMKNSVLQTEQAQPTASTLSWRFPEHPLDPVISPPVKFDLRRPVPTNRIAVRCGESRVQVEVSQDLLGVSVLINPEEITLGGCPATEVDHLSHVLVFESELHDCGSTLVMTENAFIYAFTLVYNPKVLGTSGIVRSQDAVIGVECHYPR